MASPISPPAPRQLLPPLLASLPASAVSSQPPTALLPLLSPILRQRVQLLSSATKEPWLPLLCYDTSKAAKLSQIAKSDRLEPHPVSGEVEVDYDNEVEIRYQRIDEETLQALMLVNEFEVCVKLVWCVGDQEGGGDGWRIGEVNFLEPEDSGWGWRSITEAEGQYKTGNRTSSATTSTCLNSDSWQHVEGDAGEEEDDDDYWAQYDNTPGRTPAVKRSPAPDALRNGSNDDDAYYAQYAQVQPAMDNHDPDEAAQNGEIETSLGKEEVTQELRQDLDSHPEFTESSRAWSEESPLSHSPSYEGVNGELAHPRPSSSSGSSGSITVAKLERTAEALGQSEVGIEQHISRSIRSLYQLSKVIGMERTEFSRIVHRELDVLSLMDEED